MQLPQTQRVGTPTKHPMNKALRVNPKAETAFIRPLSERGPKQVRSTLPWKAKEKLEGQALPLGISIKTLGPYEPAKHNPQVHIRAGANEHLQYKSLSASAQVTYRDRGHQ